MKEFPMTYEESLAVITACCNGDKNKLKGALQVAQRALLTEIGRGRRFDTDLESAESDYVRDIAYDQDLEGENADDFFGKVKADGFDLMEAFHDGAEWQHDRDAGDERWTDFDHVKEILRLVLESHMHGGESDEVLAELDQQVRDAWRAKKELKEMEQKHAEWSEEDETRLTNIIIMLKEGANHHFTKDDITKAVDWLKSIRPQSHWKPSKEQMKALEHFVRSIGESGFASPYEGNTNLVYSLLSELKKLKG